MADGDVLVIASKIKNYIKTAGDMKCSAKVIDTITEKVKALCDAAIVKAKEDKRKTVQERDF